MSPTPVFPARRWRQIVTSLIFLGALAQLLPISPASASLTETPPAPVPSIDWSMPERYGLDANRDGLIDTWTPRDVCKDDATDCQTLPPTTSEPMRPDTWHVRLDACGTTGATSFAWRIIGYPDLPVQGGPGCDGFFFEAPAEGTYRMELTASGAGGATTIVRDVIVQDFLIVSLGDSYGSGEGNPDHESHFGGPAARWSERRCHRTAYAGSARAAYELEMNDPRTSVTFLHLACSGALATTGLLEPYAGLGDTPEAKGMAPLRPQVDVAKELVQGREIDATYVSIGGNDSNFANVVVSCMALNPCNPVAQGQKDEVKVDLALLGGVCGTLGTLMSPIITPVGGAALAVTCGIVLNQLIAEFAGKTAEHWIHDGLIGDGNPADVDTYRLSNTYQDLDEALGSRLGMPAHHDDRVFLSEYVDATRKENGVYCPTQDLGRLLDDYRLPGLTKEESVWLDVHVEQKLNSVVHHNANRFGWTSVDGIYEGFKGHGMCSNDPFMRGLLPETLLVQGDKNGAVHPNRRGHEVYRNRILEAWLPKLYPGGGAPGIPATVGDDVEFFVRDFIEGRDPRRPEQAPVAVADVDGPIMEGSTVTAENGSYDDGELRSAWTSADAGVATVSPADSTQPIVTGVDDGTTDVALTVTDARGQTASVTRAVTVQNVAPTVSIGETPTVPEGTSLETTATVTDPGVRDTHSAVVDHGDGSTVDVADVAGRSVPVSHAYADDGTYTLRVDATDDDEGTGSGSRAVTVTNVAPTIESLTVPLTPIPVGSPVPGSALFSDPGTGDTHRQQWSWGDGELSTTEQAQGTVTASHVYDEPGLYTVELLVTDDDGGVDQRSVQYVVVYDPTGGFATGGGVMESPAGAYQPDPTLSGPATFSFVSKYAKGATVPTGNTSFKFKAADFRFDATQYQWLVVSGTKATYKGTGTVNGVPGFGFLLATVDGDSGSKAGVDRLRLKVWDLDSGDVVYDNQVGASDDTAPVTAVQGQISVKAR